MCIVEFDLLMFLSGIFISGDIMKQIEEVLFVLISGILSNALDIPFWLNVKKNPQIKPHAWCPSCENIHAHVY